MFRARLKKSFMAVVLMSSTFFLTSCVYLVVGGLGALGGYVVSPDTVEGLASYDMDTVWDATVEIVSIMGLVQEQNETGGYLIAKVNKATVTINVLPVNSSAVKLTVKSRKGIFPRIQTAQDVYIKIMSRVEGVE